MASNINISQGQETPYYVITPKNMSVSGVMMPAKFMDLQPDTYYKFKPVGYLNVTLIDENEYKYQEYMFEFTAEREGTMLRVNSSKPLHWTRPITITSGNIYQVSVVNGVVVWSEVTPA